MINTRINFKINFKMICWLPIYMFPPLIKWDTYHPLLMRFKWLLWSIAGRTSLALRFGFHAIASTFFSRAGMPDDLRLDGREYSGLICEKPVASSVFFLEKNKESPPIQAANII